jgi:DNA-directed RNA polymerase specialized sigma24 family protein
MTTPIACPVWLLAGLGLLPLAAVVVLGLALTGFARRLAAVEREVGTLRRGLAAPPGGRTVHPPAFAVPRGPRAASASPVPRLPEPAPPAPPPPTLIAVPDLADASDAAEDDPIAAEVAAFEERFGEVLQLADAGLPLAEIARACGLPAGQVELIVGLGRRVRRAVAPRTA